MSNSYRLFFCGDIVHGYEIAEVKKNLASVLKKDAQSIEILFSGETHLIKTDPDLGKCEELGNIFLCVGAVCHIEDPNSQTGFPQNVITENSLLQSKQDNPKLTNSKLDDPERLQEKMTDKISQFAIQIKSLLHNIKVAAYRMWVEGSDSIKSDLKTGGMKILIENRYFIVLLAVASVFSFVIIYSFSYEGKVMPLTEKNYSRMINHIEFVKKAFTLEELERMQQNPTDYLDYLIVDPVVKMGYEFEASIEKISVKFLKDAFSPEKEARARTLLAIVNAERDKLYQSGIITEDLKKKLDKVSKKMAK